MILRMNMTFVFVPQKRAPFDRRINPRRLTGTLFYDTPLLYGFGTKFFCITRYFLANP